MEQNNIPNEGPKSVISIKNLHKAYGIKRIVVSTYQSVTGTGAKAVRQLECEQQGLDCEKAYPHKIHENILPHGGDFLENGYTTEAQKLVDEQLAKQAKKDKKSEEEK